MKLKALLFASMLFLAACSTNVSTESATDSTTLDSTTVDSLSTLDSTAVSAKDSTTAQIPTESAK
jgi:uncharacterized lipoprotein YajG